MDGWRDELFFVLDANVIGKIKLGLKPLSKTGTERCKASFMMSRRVNGPYRASDPLSYHGPNPGLRPGLAEAAFQAERKTDVQRPRKRNFKTGAAGSGPARGPVRRGPPVI
jgi:hypothetical protein